ncbi:two-component system response regulator QseB [Inhella inkyongensis]|uniref:Two-component system response regulator QseB n=1 Tax=Inhella inkyongensis TaxID=392593 RepID=A0A840S7I5_9BURK|nr:response regulator transcription factor [Inhella inkyongensis]MBB5205468.1 two-component system response regulator QseB [Inhella inkyongensis]
MQVLLIEDDLDLGQATLMGLQQHELQVTWVRNLERAGATLQRQLVDAVVLDLGLPDGDGVEWLAQQRKRGMALPVLILSARDGLGDRLRGLGEGADDYLVKPFALDELVMRLRAIWRRSHGQKLPTLCGLEHDAAAMQLRQDGQPLTLTQTEYQLLLALLRRQGAVVSRSHLEDLTRGGVSASSLDVHMSNLRRKLAPDTFRTLRGIGYALIIRP